MIARRDAPCGGFSSGAMRLGDGDALEDGAILDGSEKVATGERRGLLEGDTCADLTEGATSCGSGGDSTPVTSVTDMLRRFLPISAPAALVEDDAGLRMEKPNVPKTLRDGFRFVAVISFLGV